MKKPAQPAKNVIDTEEHDDLAVLRPEDERPSPQHVATLRQTISHLRQEMAERRKAEARYRDLYENSPAMLVSVQDKAGQPIITDCNQTFLDILGYERGDVIGRSLLDFYTPDSQQAFRASQEGYEAALQGQTRQVERELFACDGRIVFTLLRAVPDTTIETGRPGLQAMFVDITERKLAEEAWHASEKKFLTAFMYSPVPMVITSLEDSILLEVNGSFLHFTNRHHQDLIGMPIEKVINLWETRGSYQKFLERFEHNDQVQIFETEFHLRSGKTGHALMSSALITISSQTCVLSIIQDITEQKASESSLRNLTSRLQTINAIARSLLSASSAREVAEVALQHLSTLAPFTLAVIYRYDDDLRSATVLASNAEPHSPLAAGRTIPHTQNQQTTESVQPIYYISDVNQLPQTKPEQQDLAAAGMRSIISVLFVTRGRPIGALHIGNAEPCAYSQEHLNIVREVADSLTTAVHQANLRQELQKYTDDLEEKVQARTTELHRANAELTRANRLKDEFIANMSHELRTPLSSILTKAEVLQEGGFGPVNEKQVRALQVIEQSGHHLLALINDILDLAKIGAGHMELHMTPTSLASICESSLIMVYDLAWQKQLQVKISLPETDLVLKVDPQRVRQMLVNLLSNAVKFTPTGGQIGLEGWIDSSAETVHLTVWDTGIGIAPEMAGSLFRPFVQLDGGLDRQHEGTGLGLALVSRLAKLHGGAVAITSKIGEGSRFTISLPLSASAEAPQNETTTNGWYYDEVATQGQIW